MLRLYNSLSKKKEPFASLMSKNVSLYVCGITPYDTTHLGHAFTYISFDILVRVLRHNGFKVNYTQNVTDINDRDNDILKKAREQNTSWVELSDFWTGKFLQDMSSLNWLKPNNYIKASEYIGPMIILINKLLQNGLAYQKNGSVYFDISKKKDFGKLSKLTRNEMLKISKDFDENIENPDKVDPLDFTLWRAEETNQPSHIPSFESPFGRGRPGWHIECSAMAISTLGEQIDIHGGGIDLIYPHHEAEIAQSEGATLKTPFSRFWMHNAPVSYKDEKMSKSLGNLIMVSDLLKNYSPNAIRWYLLLHHYRQPFEFFDKDLKKSENDCLKIQKYINHQSSNTEIDENIFNKFINALEDDLNTPIALQIITETVKNKGSVSTLKKSLSLLGFLV
ncbi:MAG: cysteine--tRNA ligase [Candidatus Levybacteria bacterium RIFCSPLOWO2_01_FULL_39_24]|nr:MAG: cysteine--tRNA ligase [Candidatus Levybacteria bacterium RIFCSPHIGHO2_01_FULL_40_16]OGH28694.1 MAG: cysteine--tRNA ligase [Candidatus Levybacteria bacterium RIFCSPHIGHO2_12_FULL_39_9]OGH46457.1 MAG: cysteine--tRNA ligase [Candidatus Levybacteria bacterium RIFCSPLOWO2_01_FULL_39_24]